MNIPVIEAHALTKTFGMTRALAGVDLAIHRGESVAIMGASGSGKTTLLHVLAGITTPDAGSVVFRPTEGVPIEVTALGESARSRLRRERFGFVFQQINGIRRQDAIQHAASWLAALGLAGMEDRRIGELSGGQAQRVAIARAQATGAELVFADEPTGALDSHTSSEVMDALLWSTTAQGRTLVVVTHDPEVASRCTRTVAVRDGRIVSSAVAA
jgi:putative ABC transport system ATP-binding protein